MKKITAYTLFIFILAFATKTFAINCNLAKTEIDKTICSDSDLKQLDIQLNQAYDEVKAITPAKRTFIRDQQNWLKEKRDEQCSSKKKSELVSCLKSKLEKRISDLSVKQYGSMKKKMLNIHGSVRSECDEFDFYLSLIVNPTTLGERKFNEKIMSLTRSDEGYVEKMDDLDKKSRCITIDDDNVDREEKEKLGYALSSKSDMRTEVSYASDVFISLYFVDMGFTYGNAHPHASYGSINFDLKRGVDVRFDEFFDKKSIESLTNICIHDLTRRDDSEDQYLTLDPEIMNGKEGQEIHEDISETISDMNNWSFDQDGAKVLFQQYSLGRSYAESSGGGECKFNKREVLDMLSQYGLKLLSGW
jgi:uncharacterized protein